MAAEDSFITQYEYGQMLYENPRGIGCVHCHGKHGEGAVIARYKEQGEEKVLKGPDIRHADEATLKAVLKKRHRVMPTYFLTPQEIAALHYYLSHEEE
ncbi:c-type cytochrome [Hydrogenimonas sp.]